MTLTTLLLVLDLVLTESSSWTLVGMFAAVSLPDEVLACCWLRSFHPLWVRSSYPLWVRSSVIHHGVLDLRRLRLLVDSPLPSTKLLASCLRRHPASSSLVVFASRASRGLAVSQHHSLISARCACRGRCLLEILQCDACEGGVDVVGVVTPLVRGGAQVLHGDQVVELSVLLEVYEKEEEGEDGEGQIEVESERGEIKERRTCTWMT